VCVGEAAEVETFDLFFCSSPSLFAPLCGWHSSQNEAKIKTKTESQD